MPTAISFTIPKALERQFIKQAKAAFPKETAAFLIGTVAGDHLHCDELWVPDDTSDFSTENYILPQPHWFAGAAEVAEEMGPEYSVVSWWHSHPYIQTAGNCLRDRAQSEGDLDCPTQAFPVQGICVVQEFLRKGKPCLRASMRFWVQTIPLNVNYV